LAAVLGTVPLDGRAWTAVLVAGSVPLLVGQAWRHVRRLGARTAPGR